MQDVRDVGKISIKTGTKKLLYIFLLLNDDNMLRTMHKYLIPEGFREAMYSSLSKPAYRGRSVQSTSPADSGAKPKFTITLSIGLNGACGNVKILPDAKFLVFEEVKAGQSETNGDVASTRDLVQAYNMRADYRTTEDQNTTTLSPGRLPEIDRYLDERGFIKLS
jgi:hypothetical protein